MPGKIVKGSSVWKPDKDQLYIKCTVKDIQKTGKGRLAQVFNDSYQEFSVPVGELALVNPSHMDGVPDNTQLMYLEDPSFLYNIEARFNKDKIYSYTAYILIAINPYKDLGLYSKEKIEEYATKPFSQLEPHVYGIANRAFRALRSEHHNQSIVVSGESGAGKTETCKHVLSFLVSVSGGDSMSALGDLNQKLLDTNPIIEAFGNAQTIRNKNSSRFGKFFQIYYTPDRKSISGASIETYILEKSRVVGQREGERSFHVFYELLAGMDQAVLTSLELERGYEYRYLRATDTTDASDKEEFVKLDKAMDALGMDAGDKGSIFRVLAAVLHLGEIKFTAQRDGSSTVSKDSKPAVNALVKLLAINGEFLENSLVQRKINAGREQITLTLSTTQATETRDALAKYIYGQIFHFLIRSINKAVPGSHHKKDTPFVGMLDMSGFEIFDTNSFEQLCINFANEKIQKYFNAQVVDQEQRIYEIEGLRYTKVDYIDNQDIINLAEAKRMSLFALLDEESVVPKGSDRSYAQKVFTHLAGSKHLSRPPMGRSNRKHLTASEAFLITHFAGSVIYEVDGFLEKNNDTIHDELLGVVGSSTCKTVAGLVPATAALTEQRAGSGARFLSVSLRFRSQLSELMQVLEGTSSNFIRCVKPNGIQSPKQFNRSEVMTQLQYSGMCTALKLFQAGFPTRISFVDLYNRYKDVLPSVFKSLKPVTFAEALLVALDLTGGSDFQLGITKVFFRSGKLALMDQLTSSNTGDRTLIVAKVKRWLAHKRWLQAAHAVRAVIRLGKLVEKVRVVYRFRRAVRVMRLVHRFSVGRLADSQRRVYNEEKARKREEEEAGRRAREAEEKAEHEQRQQKLEEERRQIELEQRRRQEEEQQRQREEILSLSTLSETLTEEVAGLKARLQASEAAVACTKTLLAAEAEKAMALPEVKAELAMEIASKGELQTQLTYERENTQREMQQEMEKLTQLAQGDRQQLVEELDKLKQDKISLHQVLADKDATTTTLQSEAEHLRTTVDKERATANAQRLVADETCQKLAAARAEFEGQITGLKGKCARQLSLIGQLKQQAVKQDQEYTTLLHNYKTTSDSSTTREAYVVNLEAKCTVLENALRRERHRFEDVTADFTAQTDALKKKAIKAIAVKDAIIHALKQDRIKQDQTSTRKEINTADRVTALEERLNYLAADLEAKEGDLARLNKENQGLATVNARLEKERSNLITKATQAAEMENKLAVLYKSYKTDDDLAAALYGGLPYKSVAPHALQFGTFSKQGGADSKKWQERHMVLTDMFMFYYDGPNAKAPKGYFRTSDISVVERVDLSQIKFEFGFRIVLFSTGREYKFAATSQGDLDKWVLALGKNLFTISS